MAVNKAENTFCVGIGPFSQRVPGAAEKSGEFSNQRGLGGVVYGRELLARDARKVTRSDFVAVERIACKSVAELQVVRIARTREYFFVRRRSATQTEIPFYQFFVVGADPVRIGIGNRENRESIIEIVGVELNRQINLSHVADA